MEYKCDQTKTNLVKSFMKADVFPLNLKTIDHSRVLQNSPAVISPSSSVPTKASDVNPIHSSSASLDLEMLSGNTDAEHDSSTGNIIYSSQTIVTDSIRHHAS